MQKEPQRIDGDWQALTGVLASEAMPDEIINATKMTIRDGGYELNLAGTIDVGSCDIQTDVIPIKLKIVGEKGPNAGKTLFAILEWLDWEEIRIAYDLSGTDYPNSFKPVSNKTNYVATFRRC